MSVGHQPSPRNSSVQDDWCAHLPAKKALLYRLYTEQLESVYSMFSIALDEALELRRIGRLTLSAETVSVTSGLCARLASSIAGLLRALSQHSKHYGTIPNTAPLNPSHFQGGRGQRTARMNDLLSRVLLTQRSQFLHKMSALEEMVSYLDEDFRLAADEITLGASVKPDANWHVVDASHYDLNTCLREAVVLLKSFLVTIPEDQLGVFQKTVYDQMRCPLPSSRLRVPSQPKRMVASGSK